MRTQIYDIQTIEVSDSRYPRRLAQSGVTAPLYMRGDTDLNRRHVVAIVGTRSATVYASEVINRIVKDLAERLDSLLIVSGLAIGCDSMAHRAALEAGVPTAGVLAHGLDTLYPSQNRQLAERMMADGGALISQYQAGTRMFRGNFLARNKIIAGISDCVIVAESAADHGGALHTARFARRAGREVFAVPGRLGDTYSGGCNMLIAEGTARLTTGAADIISAMGWHGKDTPLPQPGLFDNEPQGPAATIAAYLREHGGEQTADRMATDLGMATGQLLALLIEMEFDGHLSALPGNRYRLCSVR